MRITQGFRPAWRAFDVCQQKAVNLSVDAALLREARDRDIDLSATLERALEDVLRQDRRTRWLSDNRPRIKAYNDQVEAHGAFADTLRSF
jgi:antitoxin CcdA